MSSCIIVRATQGFVVSTDSIAYKILADGTKIKGATKKIFRLSKNIVVAANGNFTEYLSILNAAARMKSDEKILNYIEKNCHKISSRVYILYRDSAGCSMDSIENGVLQKQRAGAISYPMAFLNSSFMNFYESKEALEIRRTGILGCASLVSAFNRLAEELCSDLAAPFNTILFLEDGEFIISGDLVDLPVSDFS